MRVDLNELPIEDRDEVSGKPYQMMQNPNTVSEDGKIKVYFRDIKKHLLEHIKESDAVVGCVAWLTDSEIIQAMSLKANASIIVQKEDFLRPDIGTQDYWKKELRRRYDTLKFDLARWHVKGMEGISYCSGYEIDPVRCLGNYNTTKSPAFPRCHHKFIVFCKNIVDEDSPYSLEPYAIWTGSFNFSENASKSLENAVYITDLNIVNAYYTEWVNVLQRSEPLDWETDWSAPEWRIGS